MTRQTVKEREPLSKLIASLNKKELVKLNEETEYALEELTAQRVAVRAELLDKIEGNGEIIGSKSYTKCRIYNLDVKLAEAKEFGATKTVPEKERIDKSALKRLVMNGAKIKHSIIERLLIREIKK